MSFGVITAITVICAVVAVLICVVVLVEDHRERKQFDRDLEEWRDEHE